MELWWLARPPLQPLSAQGGRKEGRMSAALLDAFLAGKGHWVRERIYDFDW
jgi:hypothetical protein